MKLKQLIQDFDVLVKGSKEVEITGISSDSRKVAPGHLFIAKKGDVYDGSQFIPQAVQAGAQAIVTDLYDPFLKQTQLIHSRPNEMEAKLGACYYGFPSKDLYVVGITGTKGKTTTTYLIRHFLEGLGRPCGLIGTVETWIGQQRFFSTLTTPDALTNQKLLCEMVLKGLQAVALEVSSHALMQGRVEEIEFDAAIFTNLYPDHLDYHKTMQSYAAAKRKLFEKAEFAFLNADDPWHVFMGKGFTFGIEQPADLQAKNLLFTDKGTEFEVSYQGKSCHFHSPLIGRFNVYNVLAAIAVGLHLKRDLAEMQSLLRTFPAVPGRLEEVEPGVLIDYAHTGEALSQVLQALRGFAKRRILVVFGCGGGRDPARRPQMARAAELGADVVIVTTDNPRQEDPEEIIRQIIAGFQSTKPFVERDRKKAISLAMDLAQPGDLVLIAGKGHEQGQIFAHQTLPFDDAAVARAILAEKRRALV